MLLQSNPFRGGPHVSTVWDVGEMQGGFAVMAYGMRLTFAYVAQTQEFHGQTGGLHQFGSASLSSGSDVLISAVVGAADSPVRERTGRMR